MATLALPFLGAHPALAGHFPNRPIVPGVVLLDVAQRCIETATGRRVSGILAAKFLSPAGPADTLWLDYDMAATRIRFDIRADARKIATGSFTLDDAATR